MSKGRIDVRPLPEPPPSLGILTRCTERLADGGGEETGWRGVVEHVASGRSERFRNADELVSPEPVIEGKSLAGEY